MLVTEQRYDVLFFQMLLSCVLEAMQMILITNFFMLCDNLLELYFCRFLMSVFRISCIHI